MRFLLALLLFAVSALASAANYSVTATWTDSTVNPAGNVYTPKWELEYRVNGGAATSVSNLTAATWSGVVTANPNDVIEARVRAKNVAPTTPLYGPWTAWASASAPVVYTTPGVQSTPILIVIPQ